MNEQYQQGPSQLTNVFMYTFLFLCVTFGVWFFGRPVIMWVSFYVSYYLFSAYQHLPFLYSQEELQAIKTAIRFIPTIRPTEYGIESLLRLMEYHGYFWRWISIPLLAWWGWRIKKRTLRFTYRRQIRDVYDLIEIQAKHFPASAIIRGKNLLLTHPYVGPWATYALPLDFALDNQMLWASKFAQEPEAQVDEQKMLPLPPFKPDQKVLPFDRKRKLLPHYRYVLMNDAAAFKTFEKQLGPIWNGPESLPPLEKALYAAFLAQLHGKRKEAWSLIEQLAFSFMEGERDKSGRLITAHYADTKGVDDIISKYRNHPKAVKITQLHAHRYNVIAATLHQARKSGRLMHSNFLWLKPVNRTLWYALCGDGGQCPYWEAAGLWAHAQIENLVGHTIHTPMVLGAIAEMRRTLSVEHWIDPGEYSEAHQRRLVAEANATLEREQAKQERKGPRGGRQTQGGQSVQVPARQPTPARNKPEEDAP